MESVGQLKVIWKINYIFISPSLDDPVEVLDTLVHELAHAVDDCEHKHGKEFAEIAKLVGLEGDMKVPLLVMILKHA